MSDANPGFSPQIHAVNLVRDAVTQETTPRDRAKYLRQRLQYLENWDAVEEVFFEIFEYERARPDTGTAA